MYQQPQQPPQYQQYQQPQYQQYQQPQQQFLQQQANEQQLLRSRAKGYAIAALIFLLVGVGLHLLALFPLVGILFGCLGVTSDIVGLVFLILVIATL